jgi:predicted DCC family thiol-disulfide oxidoreductase YuxK
MSASPSSATSVGGLHQAQLDRLRSHLKAGKGVVLFDGVCNLCNGWVRFVVRRDPKAHFIFAPLQSSLATELLVERDNSASPGLGSILLVERNRVYSRSSAIIRIAGYLTGAWKLVRVFALIPRPLRDMFYDYVARNRYGWFGRTEACQLPTPETAARFAND